MELIHFSKHPVTEILPTAQLSHTADIKPIVRELDCIVVDIGPEYTMPRYGGPFWVSCEDGTENGWKDWCIESQVFLNEFNYATHVELHSDANIITLQDEQDVIAFENEFGVGDGFRLHLGCTPVRLIYWEQVRSQYDAVVIPTYGSLEPKFRFRSLWYYAWDCNSGVIFHPRVIKSFKCVPHTMEECT